MWPRDLVRFGSAVPDATAMGAASAMLGAICQVPPCHVQDIEFMHQALALAEEARASGEVPVGAVLVKDDEVVASGYNRPIASHDPSAHAEIEALRAGGTALGSYRLTDTILYVTLEPCVMCAAAIVHARVRRLVFGAWDPRAGGAGSIVECLLTAGPESPRRCLRRRARGRMHAAPDRVLSVPPLTPPRRQPIDPEDDTRHGHGDDQNQCSNRSSTGSAFPRSNTRAPCLSMTF